MHTLYPAARLGASDLFEALIVAARSTSERARTTSQPSARSRSRRSRDVPAAFEDFVREAHPRLVAAVTLRTGEAGLAEEAVQEALIRAASRWEQVRGMEAPGGWVYRVAVNQATSTLRRRKLERRLRARLATEDVHHDPDTAVQLAVREAVSSLPVGQRDAVACVDLLGMTTAQAADHLNRSVDAVRGLLERGRAQVRELLAEPTGPSVARTSQKGADVDVGVGGAESLVRGVGFMRAADGLQVWVAHGEDVTRRPVNGPRNLASELVPEPQGIGEGAGVSFDEWADAGGVVVANRRHEDGYDESAVLTADGWRLLDEPGLIAVRRR